MLEPKNVRTTIRAAVMANALRELEALERGRGRRGGPTPPPTDEALIKELTHLFRIVGEETSREWIRREFGFDPGETLH